MSEQTVAIYARRTDDHLQRPTLREIGCRRSRCWAELYVEGSFHVGGRRRPGDPRPGAIAALPRECPAICTRRLQLAGARQDAPATVCWERTRRAKPPQDQC